MEELGGARGGSEEDQNTLKEILKEQIKSKKVLRDKKRKPQLYTKLICIIP